MQDLWGRGLSAMMMDTTETLSAPHTPSRIPCSHFASLQCNLLACSPLMPSGMGRKLWSLNDFELLRHLHHGYTSGGWSMHNTVMWGGIAWGEGGGGVADVAGTESVHMCVW